MVRRTAFHARRQTTFKHSRVQCIARVTLSICAVGEHTPVKLGQATRCQLCKSTGEGGCLGVSYGVCSVPSWPEGKLRQAWTPYCLAYQQ